MRESLLYNDKFQLFIRLLTALSFGLYTVYQIYLSVMIEESRFGRLIIVFILLLITISSVLMFFDNHKAAKARTILFVLGMLLLIFVKMINIPVLFGNLDSSDPVSVMNCVIFVLTQLGAIGLVVYYITLMSSSEFRKKQVLRVVLSLIIASFYLACLIMELIMITKYGAIIDTSRKLTILSRFLYFFGFGGTAICLMLPALLVEVQHKPGEFVYSEEDDDEIDLVM